MADAEVERHKIKSEMSKRTTNVKRTRSRTSPSGDLNDSQGQNKNSKSLDTNAAEGSRSDNDHAKL